MRNTFVNTILEVAKTREDLFIISGDAGLGVFDELKEGCAENFLNLGIAEQNMISFSAGLSLSGFKVYAYNIIPFLMYRCYEQVRNDICYQRLPVTLAGIGSGVTYSLQGMTHYAVEDLGIAQTLPNLTVFSPIDPVETELAAQYSLRCNSPVYVRLAKRGEPAIHSRRDLKITTPQLLHDGEDVVIVCHGSIGAEVMKAKDMLIKEKIFPKCISLPMVLPLDTERLFALFENIKYVVTVEEHYVGCGIGSMISNAHARLDPPWKLFTLGISDKFIHEVKDLDGMRDYFGISAERIAAFIKTIVK
ncbi:transketolase family protein [Candidatus Omnitrophota bacterium]